jgi:hypothetical protein
MQGANRSDSRSYREDLQRRRPPETADACGAGAYAEVPKVSDVAIFATFCSSRCLG